MRFRLAALLLGILMALLLLGVFEHHAGVVEAKSWQVITDPAGIKFTIAIRDMEPSRGWLPQKVIPPRVPGRSRVVCVGDSVTFGFHVEADDAWPAVLERILSPGRVEVLNLGVPAWDTEQVATLLETRAREWAPDLVIWGHFENDTHPADIVVATPGGPIYVGTTIPPGARVLPEGPTMYLLRHSAIFRSFQGARFARWTSRNQMPLREDWYALELHRMARWTVETGIPMLVLTIPSHMLHDPEACARIAPGGPVECADLTRSYQAIRSAVKAEGLPSVDGMTAFKAGRKPSYPNASGPGDMAHPNPEGHRLLAQAVAPEAARMLGLTGR